jgi:hypothetical protein
MHAIVVANGSVLQETSRFDCTDLEEHFSLADVINLAHKATRTLSVSAWLTAVGAFRLVGVNPRRACT